VQLAVHQDDAAVMRSMIAMRSRDPCMLRIIGPRLLR
jgi:hypothetical protein